MTPTDSNDDHLAELRRRWEEDPGSRIFLQLAEEYRRAGRNREALEVLEKGMEAHPKQVSGLVSLGRIHLALDQPADAAEALEEAVEIDPTNPMALKLATEAHLQAGDRAMAKQRLELYKLLNAGDEDTESLEARVEGREPASTRSETPHSESPPQPETPRPSMAGSPDGSGEGGSASAGSWSPTAAWPGLPQGEAREPGAEPPPVKPAQAADAVSGGYASEFTGPERADEAADDRPEPFADLLAGDGEHDYLTGLDSEGIFQVDDAEVEAASSGEPVVREEAVAQEASAVPEETGTAEEPEHADDAEPFPELSAESEADAGDSPWDLIDAEAVAADEPPAAVVEEAGEDDALVVRDEALPVTTPEDALVDATAEAVLPAPAATGETSVDGPRPTVTLGQLYLDQGHHSEALAIFEAVLERDPNREAAAEGRRAALAAQQAAEGEAPSLPSAPPAGFTLEAGDLLRGADPSKPRKVALLEAYLDRIRGQRAS